MIYYKVAVLYLYSHVSLTSMTAMQKKPHYANGTFMAVRAALHPLSIMYVCSSKVPYTAVAHTLDSMVVKMLYSTAQSTCPCVCALRRRAKRWLFAKA